MSPTPETRQIPGRLSPAQRLESTTQARRYLQQLSPHVKEREGAQIITQLLDVILDMATDGLQDALMDEISSGLDKIHPQLKEMLLTDRQLKALMTCLNDADISGGAQIVAIKSMEDYGLVMRGQEIPKIPPRA